MCMLFARRDGIIDWEMSCFSDPAQDLGWALFFFKLYDHLKTLRGFFFSQYWEKGEEFNIEARVYFYEVLAAIKIYTYTRSVQQNHPNKFKQNQDFFDRVLENFPKYLARITHQD